MDWLVSAGGIFGGCCSNVYLFERLVIEAKRSPKVPDMGSLVTLCQFVLVALVSAAPLIDKKGSWKRLYLKQTQIPLLQLLQLAAMYFTVSVLNNSVWRFGLSVPVHIMFRSSSTVISVAVGYYLGGKHYSRAQICSCLLMTAGAMLAISLRSSAPMEWLSNIDWRFYFGIAVLTFSSVLGSLMGLKTERIYATYGNHWQETIFYNHLFGIPLFALLGGSVFKDLEAVWLSSPKILLLMSPRLELLSQFIMLALNSASQVVCARGVNQLGGLVSSLTVTVVLMVRKFVSLALSAYFFGNHFNRQGYIGAALLVIGTIQYSVATRVTKAKKD